MADPTPAFDVSRADGPVEALEHIHASGLQAAAVIDGASLPELRLLLDQTKLPYESLFIGPDAAILQDEAPLLVTLPQGERAVATALLSRLHTTPQAAFILIGFTENSPRIRRHLRKWLSVRLPRDAEEWTPKDKPVLFRFYDPAILGLFLQSLTLSQAAAFAGPVTIWATPGHDTRLWTVTAETLATPAAISGPEIYRITPAQYVILAQYSVSTFETALFTYLRDEFAVETTGMTDVALHALIDQAMQDGQRIGDTRPGSVVSLAVLRLLRPDIMTDDFIWSEIMGNNPEGKNPNQRVGLLEAYHFTDLATVTEFDAFYARLARFWEFY